MNRHGQVSNRRATWHSIHRRYLEAVYELAELRDRNGVPPGVIVDLLDLTEDAADEVLEFLVEAGMVVWPAKGELMLTEVGLRKAEELRLAPQAIRLRPGVSLAPAPLT